MALEYVDGLVNYLIQIAYSIVYTLFYPVIKLFSLVIGLIVYIWTVFANFFNAVIGLFNNFYSFVSAILTMALPSPMVMLLCIGLLIVLAMFIYSYVKDISIFGWKL